MSEAELEKIVETLSNLKVLELSKLKKILEEKWDVTAAAPMVAAAPVQESAGEAKPAAESTEFQVVLEEVPQDKKIAVIKLIREITGANLKEAKEVAENPPKVLKESAAKAEAEGILEKFKPTGAKVTLKGL